jgi:hypothetical protein
LVLNVGQVTFAPVDAATNTPVEGLEARIVAHDGAATPQRSWTGPVPYFLTPGTYKVSLLADGFFDCMATFQVRRDSKRWLWVRDRALGNARGPARKPPDRKQSLLTCVDVRVFPREDTNVNACEK